MCILIGSQGRYLDNLDAFRGTSSEKSAGGTIMKRLERLLSMLT
jgi:hypothetical protein